MLLVLRTNDCYRHPIPILLPLSTSNGLGVSTRSRLALSVAGHGHNGTQWRDRWLLEPYAVLRKMPGFFLWNVQALQLGLETNAGLISVDNYALLLRQSARSVCAPRPRLEVLGPASGPADCSVAG